MRIEILANTLVRGSGRSFFAYFLVVYLGDFRRINQIKTLKKSWVCGDRGSRRGSVQNKARYFMYFHRFFVNMR